ncbi:50S ribosomal protein L33 [Candidatus Saccharibacteria bacterium]|nr:50S ribosomal protein L33 [Candidatus Saccharibacteria bacterium]
MAKKNNTKRKTIALVSQLSKDRTYITRKNSANTPGKITLRKYDPKLRQHVEYKEVTNVSLGRNKVKERKG